MILKEVAVAAIAFKTTHQSEHIGRKLKALLARRSWFHAPEPSAAVAERDGNQHGMLPAEEPAAVAAQFRRLDPGIVNEVIPAFFIGRNKEGFWIARDGNGRFGGIFLLETSAVAFARKKSRPTGCATIYPVARFELDLENRGNPLVTHLAALMRLWRRLTGFTGE